MRQITTTNRAKGRRSGRLTEDGPEGTSASGFACLLHIGFKIPFSDPPGLMTFAGLQPELPQDTLCRGRGSHCAHCRKSPFAGAEARTVHAFFKAVRSSRDAFIATAHLPWLHYLPPRRVSRRAVATRAALNAHCNAKLYVTDDDPKFLIIHSFDRNNFTPIIRVRLPS